MEHSPDLRNDEQHVQTPWEDIDSELSESAREVCMGYGSWERARAVIRAAHGAPPAPGPPSRVNRSSRR